MLHEAKWVCYMHQWSCALNIYYIELSPHIVSEAFYSGELEAELRRIGLIDYRFRYDSDRETCMEMIEKMRRKTLYEHPPDDCVKECKKRGINYYNELHAKF